MTWPVMWPVRRADVGSLGAPLVRLVHLQPFALRELVASMGGRNGKAQARTSLSNRCDGKKNFALRRDAQDAVRHEQRFRDPS
jgi:hypothetical protein